MEKGKKAQEFVGCSTPKLPATSRQVSISMKAPISDRRKENRRENKPEKKGKKIVMTRFHHSAGNIGMHDAGTSRKGVRKERQNAGNRGKYKLLTERNKEGEEVADVGDKILWEQGQSAERRERRFREIT